MRILLLSPRRPTSKYEAYLNPPGHPMRQDDLYAGAGTGLLVVAALTPPDIEVVFIDDHIEPIDYDAHYDLVAISAMTSQALRAYEIASGFRAKGVKVVIGGIHATLLPYEVKQYCDAVAIGEAEEIWPEIIEDLRLGRLKDIYRASGPCDMSSSPIPRYDLAKDKGHDRYWVNTTRGCPFKCSFCCSSAVFGSKYRYKPVDQVIAEVEHILRIHGKRKPSLICFSDDNMFVNRARAKEIMKRLVPLKIRWFAQTDVSIADDEEMLALLKESGCAVLFIGFESLSRASLDALGNRLKANYVESYSRAIASIQAHCIGVMGAFIVGLDNDDTTCFDKIADFVIDNHLLLAQISILTPLPGTPLREQLAREKRLLPTDWSRYSMTEVNFLPKRMTVDQLSEGIVRIYARIYDNGVMAENKKHLLLKALKWAELAHVQKPNVAQQTAKLH